MTRPPPRSTLFPSTTLFRPPSATPCPSEEGKGVRLACVRHAASVYPEPGSNSPSKEVSTLLAWSSGNAQWLRCDPGQAAVQCCPYLAVRRCTASCLLPLVRQADTKQEIDRNCLLVRGARRVNWCVLRLDQETVTVLLSTLQLLRSL